jgi:hypothetical protein
MGPGWHYCSACRDKFTVRVGSIFERSHIPLHKWLLAFRLITCSKKGVSAHQIHRTLGITYKSAWFLMHRIREAMTDTDPATLGGEGKTVEADGTFYGYREGGPKWILHPQFGWQRDRGSAQRMTIVTLVERGGAARSIPAEDLKVSVLRAIVLGNADTKSKLMTDERHTYETIGARFAGHGAVNHGTKEYVRGEAHVNSAEGFFSIFKRGMTGIYQHCSERHLHRYLAEFDFRYPHRIKLGVDDTERTRRVIKGAGGKRLTYRRTRS